MDRLPTTSDQAVIEQAHYILLQLHTPLSFGAFVLTTTEREGGHKRFISFHFISPFLSFLSKPASSLMPPTPRPLSKMGEKCKKVQKQAHFCRNHNRESCTWRRFFVRSTYREVS